MYMPTIIHGKEMRPVLYDDVAKSHVTIQFYQTYWDYTDISNISRGWTKMGVMNCRDKDFSSNPELK